MSSQHQILLTLSNATAEYGMNYPTLGKENLHTNYYKLLCTKFRTTIETNRPQPRNPPLLLQNQQQQTN